MSWEIVEGDAVAVLRRMPAASVHCVVTSPPYWSLRDYGIEPQAWGGESDCEHDFSVSHFQQRGGTYRAKARWQHGEDGKRDRTDGHPAVPSGASCSRCGAWLGALGLEPTPELYVEHVVSVFREVRRVLRRDGTLWLNIGDSYAAKARGNDAGWDKSRLGNPGRQQKRSAAALRKTGERHRGQSSGLKSKDLVGIPWMLAFALRADGWWLRSEVIWSKPNPMPESVLDRPSRSHEQLFLLAKRGRYFYDREAIREPLSEGTIKRLMQAGFDRQTGGPKDYAKTGVSRHRSSRQALVNLRDRLRASPQLEEDPEAFTLAGRNRRTVWEIPTEPTTEDHPATFAKKLVEPCVLAGTSAVGVCAECGAPRVRIIRRKRVRDDGETVVGRWPGGGDYQRRLEPQGVGHWRFVSTGETIGWRQTCKHEAEVVPATVLDPFAGIGTTVLVADRLGRRGIGIDLNPESAATARRRLAADAPLFALPGPEAERDLAVQEPLPGRPPAIVS